MKSDVVRLNHAVTGFTEDFDGVTLKFMNGESARGDLLIGADGVKSAVRRQMRGRPPIPAIAPGASLCRSKIYQLISCRR